MSLTPPSFVFATPKKPVRETPTMVVKQPVRIQYDPILQAKFDEFFQWCDHRLFVDKKPL